MSAAISFARIAGVRACLVGNSHGQVLEESRAGPNNSAVVAAAAALADKTSRLGTLLGLGAVEVLTTRTSAQSWVIASHGEWCIAVQVDPSKPTGPVESALRTSEWVSSVEWDVSTSEIECVPPGDLEDKNTPANAPQPIDLVASSTLSREERSGTKWRAAPKYRQVIIRPSSGPSPFEAKEAPTCPFPSESVLHDVATMPPDALADAPIFAGDLKMFGFVDLIEFLGNARRTGALTCSSQGRAATIHLRSGKVVAAVCSEAKSLRAHLLAKGAIGREQLSSLPEISSNLWWQADIAATLVNLGIATPPNVRNALDEQLRGAIAELLNWSDGDFAFDPEPASTRSPLELDLEFDPQALLLEILRTKDERAAAAGPGA